MEICMDLRETTSYLLRTNGIGNWIRRADNYIQTYNRMPDGFTLPADHAVLKAVIESFASDNTAWAEYIKALRDASQGVAYDELHDLYRTISVRALQVVRRTRLRKAVTTLLPKLEALRGRPIVYDEQLQIAKVLEQLWGAARMALMARERNVLTGKRLTTEDRAVILQAYWKDIDNKLEKGDVPLFDKDLSDLLEPIK